jgi:hypothetical protein
MFALGPRVGKIDVQRPYRVRWEKMLEQVSRLDSDQLEIPQPRAYSLAINLPEPAEQSFDSKKIRLRMRGSIPGDERAIAAAQFHFDFTQMLKEAGKIERFED